MNTLFQDVAYAWRGLRRAPGFTLLTVFILAAGIGANTAVFSLVNGLLLRELPYPADDRLVMLWNDNRRAGVPQDRSAWANLADYRSQSRSIEDIGAFVPFRVSWRSGGEPASVAAVYVSSAFLRVLGVPPMMGRPFRPTEDQPGAGDVCLLGDGFWQRSFGGDPQIVGKTVELSHRPYTVIGVMPPGFQFPPGTQAWLNVASGFGPDVYAARSSTLFSAVARLRATVSLPSARAELSGIASRLEQQYEENEGYGVSLVPLREQFLGDVGAFLLLLLGTVGFVLLIACANTANLLLARGAARQREFAVRMALGAGRGRLIRQLLTEGLLLAAVGGIAGVTLGGAGLKLFASANPFKIWRLDQVAMDGRVLGFSLAVPLLTGLLFGVIPALLASRQAMTEALKGGGLRVTGGPRASRLRESLVTIEVALALLLLVGAGLMLRSVRQLQKVDLGFSPAHLLTFRDQLPRDPYKSRETTIQFHQELLERIAALPGVSAAAASTHMFIEETSTYKIDVEGSPLTASGKPIEVPEANVSAAFFPTMGIALRRGRMFTDQDQLTTPQVVMVNETMARRFWPGEDAIGKRIRITGKDDWIPIVGVVADYRRLRLESAAGPEFYRAAAQSGLREGQVVVRAAADPRSLAPAIRRAVRSLDPSLPVENLETMEQLVSERLLPRYYTSLLISLLALIALIMAAVGIFGVLSYQVRQRTPEIGIRVALGARPWDITALVVGRGLLLALLGMAAGLAGWLALARLVSGFLFGVSALDVTNLFLVSVVLLGATLLASYLPARRAARVSPMEALRSE